jgi:hypothetical protein
MSYYPLLVRNFQRDSNAIIIKNPLLERIFNDDSKVQVLATAPLSG